MKRLATWLLLGLLALTLTSCGVFDLTGANATARARAEADEEREETQQERERTAQERERTRQREIAETAETDRVQIRENAHTERMLILSRDDGQANDGASSGTDHDGGITAALSVGAGIGWPVILIVGLIIIGGSLSLLWLRHNDYL